MNYCIKDNGNENCYDRIIDYIAMIRNDQRVAEWEANYEGNEK